MGGDTIAKCVDLQHSWYNLRKCRLAGSSAPRVRGTRKFFTLIVPFHPIWYKANLARVLSSVVELFESELRFLFGRDRMLGFRVAWKPATPSLAALLRKKPESRE